ncbi:hypothetical protein KIH27_14365 [Mycobacterium sp. M1]|uniref:Uncharacterized protein n=1 Tax=Mycolicibacter acidiphilus TaxID=2835306 RepID=A0ABS5RMK1_9MYCO|nr:hypothetical protein [Mycolicibacter acidiphilus]MBS9534773.1 hypothetical protein [Mycolicibacter acidiphilus]
MTQATNNPQAINDLMARTLESLRVAYEDLTELAEHKNGITAVVQTARGTALIHDLRKQIDLVNKLLPFKG